MDRVEIFSFSHAPEKTKQTRGRGLGHLALRVVDLDAAVRELSSKGVAIEPVRIDENTGSRFTFFADPDGLPVIPPFFVGCSGRIHAAVFSFKAGGMPPMPMLGRSLL